MDRCNGILEKRLKLHNVAARLMLAEFLGTFILILFGCASVAQSVLSNGAFGGFLSINFGWGLGVTMGVYVSAGISGGHLNPAVTVAMALLGRVRWRHVPFYMIGQYTGAFVAAAVVYGVYYDGIQNYDGGQRHVTGDLKTAGIFATYPQSFVSTSTGCADQIVGTAVLLICVMALTDPQNAQPHKGLTPFLVGLVVLNIGICIGMNAGYAINPARDLSPRIFTAIAGWGKETFSFRNYNWFWVPIVGPHIGAILGAWFYQLCVGLHWPSKDWIEDTPADEKKMTEIIASGSDGDGTDGAKL